MIYGVCVCGGAVVERALSCLTRVACVFRGLTLELHSSHWLQIPVVVRR